MRQVQDCPTPEQIRQLEEGRIDGGVDAILDHIEACERCLKIYNDLEENTDIWLQHFAAVSVADLRRARDEMAKDTAAGAETSLMPMSPVTTEPSESSPSLSPPCDLKHYKVLRRVGRGGMGEVYEAWDTLIERRVAIKVQCKASDVEADARFREELSVNGQLNHPNIVKTYAGERHDGSLFLIQEYLDGSSLQILANQSQLGHAKDLIRDMVGVCQGVQALHAKGLVHRDIKPGNVMRLVDGSIKLIDYGLALHAEGTPSQRQAGAGTPKFMAPEQLLGKLEVDYRSDIYSLGRMIQYLAGCLRVPADDHNEKALLTRLLRVAARMCERLPADRPGNVAEVIAELQRLLEPLADPVVSTKPSRPIAGTPTDRGKVVPLGARQGSRNRWGRWVVAVVLLAPIGFVLLQIVFKTDRAARVIVENHQPGDVLEIGVETVLVREIDLGKQASFTLTPGEYRLSLREQNGREISPAILSVAASETLTVRINGVRPEPPPGEASPLTVAPISPREQVSRRMEGVSVASVLSTATMANVRRVVVSSDGTKAVVGTYAGGLGMVDVSSMVPMRAQGEIEKIGSGWIEDLAWADDGKFVYAISHEIPGGLHVIDAAAPESPVEVGFYQTPSYAHSVAVGRDGQTVFVADGSSGLLSIDVSTPSAPAYVSRCRDIGYAQWCVLSSDRTLAFVPCAQNDMKVIDVSDPEKMVVVGTVSLAGECWRTTVSPTEPVVYVADRSGVIRVVDVTEPSMPHVVDEIGSFGRHSRLCVFPRAPKLGVAHAGLSWFDISTAGSPEYLGTYEFSDGGVRDMAPMPSGEAALAAVFGEGLVALKFSANDGAGADVADDSSETGG